ncbi:MAG: hypothetical protein JOZ37_04795 [Actinobacteria bacterium]|nr:hypothetical protein [Actinomycetota bacterium]MBV8959150.1 hypothetical protein [Actinomycetota bacterium]MBV9254001.1 hypothetical protein [Actinomycetota bacterium]MBV9663261.1 hypothetical protein [Actinomycetota bacterium]MBV9933810.1 hypothetical protein [Actinomycetota bacterium]
MSEPGLARKLVALHEALDSADIPHAVGGAIALGYYAEPRATIDLDINVFVSVDQHKTVFDAIVDLGVTTPASIAALERDAQTRAWWGRTPIDLFFDSDAFHGRMRAAARLVPFGDVELLVLAPEHLLICKAVFDRRKDWLDIDDVLTAVPDLDADEVRTWLSRIVGENDQRWTRMDEALRRLLGR